LDLTLSALLFLPVGLGLLGFVEPCTIGSHMIFLSSQERRENHGRAVALASFIVARILVMGAFGAVLGLLGQTLVEVQTFLWLVFGFAYLAIGLAFAMGRGDLFKARVELGRGAWRHAENPWIMGAAFGLNIPACAAPIVFALLGMTISSGAWLGFMTMALFALALSVPLIPMALVPRFAKWLTRAAATLRARPWIIATVFVILGLWSIYFGLFVDPVNWSGH